MLASDTDAGGTGEEAGAPGREGGAAGADVGFDRVVGADEAGLGGGLDQAEEALADMPEDERRAAQAGDAPDDPDADDDPTGEERLDDALDRLRDPGGLPQAPGTEDRR